MNALKEKVSDQLSRLFADSPNSSASSPSSPPSPSPAWNRKARPYTNEEESLSPYFSFSMPSFSFSGSKSNKHQTGLKPVQSLPVKCNSKVSQKQGENSVKFHECYTEIENGGFQNFYEDDKEHTGVCANKLTVNTRHVKEDGAPGTNSSDSDVFEEARDHETPQKPLPEHLSDSAFISSELYEFLQSSLPNIVKGCQWVLVYSTLKHGISLRTLIRKSADIPGPCLLVVGDKQGAVFGGLLDGPLNPTPKRKYQGTNQTFVFTTIYGEPRLFRPTGANRYYHLCLNELLAFGGGGSFALCLDGDLLNGTSGPCETFGNLCLAHASEFELKNVELWGFMHSSRYLT